MRTSGTSSYSVGAFPCMTTRTYVRKSTVGWSVGAGELQVVLGDEAEDHLPADRRDPADAGDREERAHAVLLGEAGATVRLDRLVDGARGGLRGGVLRA